jgi:hypothetical protein
MKKTVLLLAATTLLVTGCKKKFPCINAKTDTIEESRSVNNFSKVDLKISADVYITQDTTLTSDLVTVIASDNVLKYIETNVNGTTLEIESERCIRGKGNIEVHITTNDLLGVSVSGSGDVYVQNEIHTSSMELNIAGSGSIDMQLKSTKTEVDISGSGDMDITGLSHDLDISISGSGEFEAYGLATATADISISGSGCAKVNVSERLDVRIAGSGDVYYIGDAQVHQSVTGSGSINNQN